MCTVDTVQPQLSEANRRQIKAIVRTPKTVKIEFYFWYENLKKKSIVSEIKDMFTS